MAEYRTDNKFWVADYVIIILTACTGTDLRRPHTLYLEIICIEMVHGKAHHTVDYSDSESQTLGKPALKRQKVEKIGMQSCCT